MNRRSALAAAALAASTVIVSAGPAAASCAGPAERVMRDVDVLFIGEVRDTSDTHAILAVLEVWQGPDLAPEVSVQTSHAQQPSRPLSLLMRPITSVDAHFEQGITYVVGATRSFQTNECIVVEFTAGSSVAALRPGDTRGPVADGATGAEAPLNPWVPTLGGAGAGLVLAFGGLLVWRRRRRTASSTQT